MTAIDIPAGPLAEADHRSQLRRAVIASTVGTTIEWYDFLLYSVVTDFKLSSSLHSHSQRERRHLIALLNLDYWPRLKNDAQAPYKIPQHERPRAADGLSHQNDPRLIKTGDPSMVGGCSRDAATFLAR